MKTIIRFIFLFIFGLFSIQLTSCGNDKPNKVEFKEDNSNDSDKSKKDKKKLKISKNIKLTKHAKCRMKCRGIDADEIEEVLVDGKINNQKSDTKGKKKGDCPTYAIEYTTKRDKQNVRVIIAACEKETKIVTVIDLGVKVDNCPGDCK